MTTMTARELLRAEYGDSPNFMTPHVLGRGKLARTVAYELSTGMDFEHEPMYGVSIVFQTHEGVTDRVHTTHFLGSDSFTGPNARNEARSYIAALKQGHA